MLMINCETQEYDTSNKYLQRDKGKDDTFGNRKPYYRITFSERSNNGETKILRSYTCRSYELNAGKDNNTYILFNKNNKIIKEVTVPKRWEVVIEKEYY